MTDPSKTVERVSDPAFSIDEDLCITGWNERLEELTGYSSEEVLGQTCDEILQAQLPGGAPLCRADCKGHECLVAGKPFEVSACQLKAKNGRLIDAEFGSVVMETGPDRGAEGQELAVILVRNRESAKSIQNSERLQIHTLGDIELLFDDQPIAIENWKRKQAITLLKVLAVSDGGTIHRERLAAILWPDADGEKGWERLRVTIYALRKELKAAGLADPIVETVDRSYRLKSENVWIDFQAFEASNDAGRAFEKKGHFEEAQQCFETAQKLYRGDFLASDIYVDWCAEKREQLRELYLEVLASLVRGYERQSQFAQAAQTCRTALVSDPCRESFLQSLIGNLVKIGRPERAQAEYLYWQSVLRDQLGLEPLPETQRLYHNLVNAGGEHLSSDVSG